MAGPQVGPCEPVVWWDAGLQQMAYSVQVRHQAVLESREVARQAGATRVQVGDTAETSGNGLL